MYEDQYPNVVPLNDTRWRAHYKFKRSSRQPGSAIEGPYKRDFWNELGDTILMWTVVGIIAGAFLLHWLPVIVAALVK